MDFPFFDVIVLALIAGFVGYRLYSVLGRRTGTERAPEERMGVSEGAALRNRGATAEKIAPLPDRGAGSAEVAALPNTGPLARGLMDVKLADRQFDAAKFLKGARAAYEMIVTAFANGDRETLRPLLSEDVFHAFDQVISGRISRKERVEFSFASLRGARITGADAKDRVIEVTVTFDSEFVLAVYNAAGAVVEGDAKAPHSVTDVWTFARDTRSSDPNWTLISTSSGG